MFEQNARSRPPQRSVEIAVVQYREGAVDYQRVLDAQRSLLQQQNSLAADELIRRHEPDRPLQGARRRLGAAPGPAVRAGTDATAR